MALIASNNFFVPPWLTKFQISSVFFLSREFSISHSSDFSLWWVFLKAASSMYWADTLFIVDVFVEEVCNFFFTLIKPTLADTFLWSKNVHSHGKYSTAESFPLIVNASASGCYLFYICISFCLQHLQHLTELGNVIFDTCFPCGCSGNFICMLIFKISAWWAAQLTKQRFIVLIYTIIFVPV